MLFSLNCFLKQKSRILISPELRSLERMHGLLCTAVSLAVVCGCVSGCCVQLCAAVSPVSQAAVCGCVSG